MNRCTCDEVLLLLPLYIDNMLSQEEMTNVREHLAACSSCESEYLFLKGIMKTAKDLPELEVTEDFQARLHDKLMAAQKDSVMFKTGNRRPVWFKNWKVYGTAAASVAIIAISVISLSNLPNGGVIAPPDSLQIEAPVHTAAATPEASQASDMAQEPAAEATLVPTGGETAKQEQPKEQKKPSIWDRIVSVFTPAPVEQQAEKQKDTGTNEEKPAPTMPPLLNQSDIRVYDAVPDNAPAEEKQNQSNAAKSTEPEAENAEAYNLETSSAMAGTTPPSVQSSGHSGGSASGGGGGSAGSGNGGGTAVKSPEKVSKVKTIIHMKFTEEGREQARSILADYPQKNGAYVIGAGNFRSVLDRLENLDGFQSSTQSVDDMSAEYNRLNEEKASNSAELETNAENSAELERRNREIDDRLAEIDQEISKNYIVIS